MTVNDHLQPIPAEGGGSEQGGPNLKGGDLIIDIRCQTDGMALLEDVKFGLRPENGDEKKLPTLLLYDAQGLRLFEEITYLEEYYLTGAEIEVLENHAGKIADRVQPGSLLLELGSGNLRKINILLKAIDAAGKDVEYYALDVSSEELKRTLAAVPLGSFNHVKCFGLHGTYDDGLAWLKSEQIVGKPKIVMTMGSSIGNFKRAEAVEFLKAFADTFSPGDSFLVGIDGCKHSKTVYHAYNDREGVTHRFILNGLVHANRLLGSEQFDLDLWRVIGEYDVKAGRHHAFVSPIIDVVVDGIHIAKDERVRIEESYKFSEAETNELWDGAGLVEDSKWTNGKGDYALHMAYKPTFQFATSPKDYASQPAPSLADWENLWAAWDTVGLGMIPKEELLSKPISLRNDCIFYLGHIPTFLDIHLSRVAGHRSPELDYYQTIFERGIDPDVDDPEKCHSHSAVPDSWPPIDDIVAYQTRMRHRVRQILDQHGGAVDHHTAKALWIAFEHEAMHLETLLYMLLQSDKMRPPPGVLKPDFEALAAQADIDRCAVSEAERKTWIAVPPRTLTLGINDPDDDTTAERFFGWDNEKPKREAQVSAFIARAQPITNEEFARFMRDTGEETCPASWIPAPPAFTAAKVASNGVVGPSAVDSIPASELPELSTSPSSRSESTSRTCNSTSSSPLTSSSPPGLPETTGTYFIRTVFGPIPLAHALHWPVSASYDQLARCAAYMGGRIPSREEVSSMYAFAEEFEGSGGVGPAQRLVRKVPAVNGELNREGVEETPPVVDGTVVLGEERGAVVVNGVGVGMGMSRDGEVKRGRRGEELFVGLEGKNVGFRNWHPVPVGIGWDGIKRGGMGGLWEWTSSELKREEGFQEMELYPGYTADFFDGKHNIVLGGSWATHPRIAGRTSFVNWYQRNYPFVWAGARLVRQA